ncbi:MAG: helix-turn-helix domain-containing protein [Actinomycetota bacterium]|nr:helix-turn-helix domain-containing protein [Actinomycetota bacterium]
MKLRKAREKIGKTQQLVATEAGMSVAGYRKLEAGGVRRPAATTIHGVSRSVGMAAHEIDEFVEVLAGYEIGTQVAYQTVALAEPQVAVPAGVPDLEDTRCRYKAGEFESDFREDTELRAEIAVLVERQQRLIEEQRAISEKLEAFGGQFAAQTQPKGN